MQLCEVICKRISFCKELYVWGWRWVVFVIWGLPYGVIGIYDTAIGQGFLPNTYPKLGSLIPDWIPTVWFVLGIIAIIFVTIEGAYRIVWKERGKLITVPNRNNLIKALVDVKRAAFEYISLEQRTSVESGNNKEGVFTVNIDAIEGYRKMHNKYEETKNKLEEEMLIAGKEIEPEIALFNAFITVQLVFASNPKLDENGARLEGSELEKKLESNLRAVISKLQT